MLEQPDGAVFALPPIEIVPAEGGVRLHAPNICPNRPRRSARAVFRLKSAHRSWIGRCGRTARCHARGYSRTDFIVSAKGPIYLETNTLPGLTKASLYPKALKAQGIEFVDFLQDQIVLAAKRAQNSGRS